MAAGWVKTSIFFVEKRCFGLKRYFTIKERLRSGFVTLYKDNQFLSPNEKSFLFVLTDATYFHDDPRKWKEDDLRACENQEPDNFGYPYELSKYEVCDIFRGLAQSFREGF